MFSSPAPHFILFISILNYGPTNSVILLLLSSLPNVGNISFETSFPYIKFELQILHFYYYCAQLQEGKKLGPMSSKASSCEDLWTLKRS